MDWYSDQNKVLKALLFKVSEYYESAKDNKLQLNNNESDIGDTLDEEEIETSFGGEYVLCELTYDPIKPEDFLKIEKEYITKKLNQVIEKEGPIVDVLLEARVRASYGLKRLGINIKKYLDDILYSMNTVRTEQIDCDNEKHYIFWPESYRKYGEEIEDNYISFRSPPISNSSGLNSVKRKIEDYPQVEIRNAMSTYIRNIGPTIKQTLIQETSIKMGFKKNGDKIEKTLNLVLMNALSSGFFEQKSDGRITLR